MNFERSSSKYPSIFKGKRHIEKKKYQRYIGKGIVRTANIISDKIKFKEIT